MENKPGTTAVMCFSSGNGGMERSALRLAEILSKITNVRLVCKRDSFIDDLYHQNQREFSCETVKFSSRVFSPAMLLQVRRLVKINVSNVIFFGASELKTLFFAFKGFDINLIVWHGTTKSKPKHDFIHRLVYSKVNYHVALSEHLRQNVKKIVPPADNECFRVINPSFKIDGNNRSIELPAHDRLRLVHIGRIAAGKGQIDAVRACHTLHHAGIAFQLDLVGPAGDDIYNRELRSVIQAAAYSASIIEHGFVDNPAEYLEQADVLVFPSYGEGMPNAFIEALHYGIPCLAYANTVFPEYISMGFHVILAKDRNVADLSEKLLTLATDISSAKQTAAHNSDLARKYFNVQTELASWKEILV